MRFTCSFLMIWLFSFSILLSLDNQSKEIRLHFPYEYLVVKKEGIFLKTPLSEDLGFGDLVLKNFYFDAEKGCYTLCNISLVCPFCETELVLFSNQCVNCGLDLTNLEDLIDARTSISVEAFLNAVFKEPSFWNEEILLSGRFDAKSSFDNRGNKELHFELVEQIKDKNLNLKMEMDIQENKEGELSGSTGCEATFSWETDNTKGSASGSVEVQRDPKGETSIKAEGEFTINY